MACALETVNREEVDAEFDGALGVPDSSALVQDDTRWRCGFELFDDGSWTISRSLDNANALFDNNARVGWVIGWLESGEEGEVDAEWLVGHGLALADLFAKVFWGRLCERGELKAPDQRGSKQGGSYSSLYDSKPSSVADCTGEFSVSDPLHASLHNRN